MPVSDKEALTKSVELFSNTTVLCIGDLILDNFVYGEVSRLSPEAPVPVINIRHETKMLGGAGNVVRNIISLGGKAQFISVVGRDKTGSELTAMVGREDNIEAYLPAEKDRMSTSKVRYIAGNQQLLRTDRETVAPLKKATQERILELVTGLLGQVDIVVLSDYAKGLLTPTLVTSIIALARKAKKPVIVDPKQKDYSLYAGATIITPNESELATATHLPVSDDKEVIAAAGALMTACDFDHVLVTRNHKGMTLVNNDGSHEHFPATAHEVFDVSGAGDTVAATLAVALGTGLSLEDSTFLSNIAAGIVVTRIGTSAVYRTDLKTALFTHELVTSTRKIMPEASALEQIHHWRESGKKIGFTNGCFDLVHPGHVSLMEQAKACCDRLIVGLNSDDSVKRLKGKGRPVQNEMSRALVLASLEAVDMIVIFREDTPLHLLEAIRPDVLVKGNDYTVDKVVGADLVKSYGGEVVLAKLSDGQSTTNIISRLAN